MLWACEKNCRYAEECLQEARAHKSFHFQKLRDRLTEMTGVYLGEWVDRFESEEGAKCRRFESMR